MTATRHVLILLVGLLAALDGASAMIEGLYCGKDNCYDGLFLFVNSKYGIINFCNCLPQFSELPGTQPRVKSLKSTGNWPGSITLICTKTLKPKLKPRYNSR